MKLLSSERSGIENPYSTIWLGNVGTNRMIQLDVANPERTIWNRRFMFKCKNAEDQNERCDPCALDPNMGMLSETKDSVWSLRAWMIRIGYVLLTPYFLNGGLGLSWNICVWGWRWGIWEWTLWSAYLGLRNMHSIRNLHDLCVPFIERRKRLCFWFTLCQTDHSVMIGI